MSDNAYKELQSAIDQLDILRGEEAVQQIQFIINLADKHDDKDAVAEWTIELLRIASHLGLFDVEMQAFFKLRHLYASSTHYGYLRDKVLWFYKWITGRVYEHVDVPRQLIETVFSQMTEFYQSEKENLRPVYSIRRDAEAFMGHLEEAAKYHELFQNTPAGESDDCAACVTNGEVCYLLACDKPEEATTAAEPIFSGKQHCEEVPAITFSRLLMPMLISGESELAEAMQRISVRQVRLVPKLIGHLANHLIYLSMTGRAKQARRLACILLGHGTRSTNTFTRLCAWRGGWFWAELLQATGATHVKLPTLFDTNAGQNPIKLPKLIERCRRETLALSIAFDHRHGNKRFEESFDRLSQLLKMLREKPPLAN